LYYFSIFNIRNDDTRSQIWCYICLSWHLFKGNLQNSWKSKFYMRKRFDEKFSVYIILLFSTFYTNIFTY
jgi:hypothetical protein